MLDLGRIDEAVWVEYSDDESYLIEFITDDMIRQEIGRDTDNFSRYVTEKMKESKPEANKPESDTFISGLITALFSTDFQIKIAVKACKDWKGIRSNGEPLDCTDENKKLLFENFANRMFFVFRESRNEKHFIGDMEEDRKN